MKRMSEVFELPVAVGDGMFDKDTIYNADHYGEWVATFEDDEQAQHAARAINHVDALADALDVLLDATVNRSSHDSINNQIIGAAKALAAYRGGK